MDFSSSLIWMDWSIQYKSKYVNFTSLITLMPEIIELKDRKRFNYRSDGTLDFNSELKRWESFERNYPGTEWYPTGKGPDEAELARIREVLQPVAELLGIELTEETLRTHNPRSLLEARCKQIGEGNIKTGEHHDRHSNQTRDIVSSFRIYELPDGRKLHLIDSGPYS